MGLEARVLVDLHEERAALDEARRAVDAKLERLSSIDGGGADAIADEYIDAVVRGAIDRMQQELLTFGRVDDDQPWRIGLYGIDDGAGSQLVVDWRAPFAAAFYQAGFDDPRGLERRVSYVGCIDDLFVEDFASGEVAGSSPLLAELSKSRGSNMKAAVATIQSDQDRLVRRAPDARLVVRGGPGTGKTVVGLHRAAWLVYNDDRITGDRILVLGPSDRFLRFVATVLPTLGEARVLQTTFSRLLGDDVAPGDPGNDPRWVEVLDRLERSLVAVAELRVGYRTVSEPEVARAVERFQASRLPWRDRHRQLVDRLMARTGGSRKEVVEGLAPIVPRCSTRQAWQRLRSAAVLEELEVPPDLARSWLDGPRTAAGALHDEVRSRFEGVPSRYSHVIVDEAQDLSLLQLRAVMRRAKGCTLVGDDAQRSTVHGIGLRSAAQLLDADLAELRQAYRMSAEIAEWLNEHAARNDLTAVMLDGIRPTGVAVRAASDVDAAAADLATRWSTVAVIDRDGVWDHKGVEYDAVVVAAGDMSPREVYLAASRAAHELVLVGADPW